MAPFVRTVTTKVTDGPGGTERHTARVDDHLHGFEVRLDVRAGRVVAASASAHRVPWSTCPGALASVERLAGALAEVPVELLRQGREHTCVHPNDLVWLAARGHRRRRYELEITPYGAALVRDGEPRFGWRLRDWTVCSPGPFDGAHVADDSWGARLAASRADDDTREAVRVLRRAATVAMGYYELDWAGFATAADVGWAPMLGSCHTFSGERVVLAERRVAPPDTSLFAVPGSDADGVLR